MIGRHARGWLALSGFAGILLLALPPATGRAAAVYGEAPALASQVAIGALPQSDKRLPVHPLLVEPEERLGVYGGTLRTAMLGRCDGSLVFRMIGYEPLVRWDPTWSHIVPGLAQSFEVSPDATVYTFHLRRGVRWSDGEPFTSADILFWYEDVLRNPALTPEPPAWLAGRGRTVAVTAPDDATVIFRFAEPNSLFLRELAAGDGTPGPTGYPRHRLERYLPRYNRDGIAAEVTAAHAASWVDLFRAKSGMDVRRSDRAGLLRELAAGRPPGGRQVAGWPTIGAWKVTEMRDGDPPELVAERNPYYWKIDPAGRQLPYIDRIVFYMVSRPDELRRLVEDDAVDLQLRHVGSAIGNDFDALARRGPYRRILFRASSANLFPLALNLTVTDPTKRALFNDRRFRIALSYAIDRPAIIRSLGLRGSHPSGVAPRPASLYYDARLARQYLDHDPARANALLDRMGLEARDAQGYRLGADKRRISIRLLVRGDKADQLAVARAIAADWRAVGIEGVPRPAASGEIAALVAKNRHEAVVGLPDGGIGALLQPDNFAPIGLRARYAVGWARWFANPGDPAAQEPPAAAKRQFELYSRVLRTTDRAEQIRLAGEILDLAADAFYEIGIAQETGQLGIIQRHVHNVPTVMIDSQVFPDPGPSNPCQYFIGGG